MNNESRIKYLFKNTLIFTLGNIGSKIISFFLIPLYTKILTTSQYGIVDLISTISMVAAPILTLNVAESVMRFGLDRNAEKDKNIQCGNIVLIIAIIVGTILIPICGKITNISEYTVYVYFYVISLAASQIYLCDLRGKELLLQYSFGNILQTFLIAILNIFFLLVLNIGITGYLLAYIISNFVVAFYAAIIGKGYREFNFSYIDHRKLKKMLSYSVVLIPNTFMWWIMNSSDRIMVTYMVNSAANGIYAVSYKLPTLVSTLTGIFNQAWSYSAIREEGAEDESAYNNRVFKTLTAVVMMIGLFMMLITKPFLKIYVSAEYYNAWKYTPFLIVGCVYLTLSTFVATSYTVHKDSFGYLFSGMFGAICNVFLNFLWIPRIGVYGAALATGISYIAVFGFRILNTRKYIKYIIFYKEFIVGSVLLILSGVSMYNDNAIGVILQIFNFVIGFFAFFRIWGKIFKELAQKILRKKE